MAKGAYAALLALAEEPILFEKNAVVAMVFRRGIPLSMFVLSERKLGGESVGEFDVDWCAADDTWAYSLTGGGYSVADCLTRITGNDRYWARSDVNGMPDGRRLARLPDKWHPERFLKDAWECDVIYCEACASWRAVADDTHPCEHIFWCFGCARWSTPDERCGCADPRDEWRN